MAPELWIILLFFLVVSVPLFLGAVVLVNRSTGGSKAEEELEELKRRVEDLESKQE